MRKLLYILIFTLAASSAAAQQMPERRLVRKGNRQFRKENFDRSVDLYMRALGADSTSFEAGYNLGNALFRSERYDTAEQTMMRAAADSTRSDTEGPRLSTTSATRSSCRRNSNRRSKVTATRCG